MKLIYKIVNPSKNVLHIHKNDHYELEISLREREYAVYTTVENEMPKMEKRDTSKWGHDV